MICSCFLQKEESNAMLADRLHTIRLWRGLGIRAVREPLFCLRGLEMYETAATNADFLASRSAYVQAVLEEQQRQRQAGHGPLDWETVHKVVAPRSALAARYATRMGWKDSLDAQSAWEPSTSTRPACLPSFSKRLSMPFTSSLPYGTTAAATTGRAPVDVYRLKELNRQFLQRMSSSATYQKETLDGSVPPTPMPRLVHSNSLSMMLLRGKQHLYQTSSSLPPNESLANSQFTRTSLQEILSQADCEL